MYMDFKLIIFLLFTFVACGKVDAPLDVNESASAVVEVKLSETSDETAKKKLKIGILGDSISTFKDIVPSNHRYYYPSEDVDDWTKTYWGVLINEYWNAELDVNASYSGGCVAPTPDKVEITNFQYRSKLFKTPDVILVHGGTNDSNSRNGVAIGDYDFLSSVEDLDIESHFRDSFIALIRNLKADYPQAQIVIIVGNYVQGDYGESVEKIAQFFDLPYVDFRGDELIDNNGNCHPNASGMARMAKRIYDETKDIIEKLY